jgi:5-methylcytosine-specific restriction endonuclease McrA
MKAKRSDALPPDVRKARRKDSMRRYVESNREKRRETVRKSRKKRRLALIAAGVIPERKGRPKRTPEQIKESKERKKAGLKIWREKNRERLRLYDRMRCKLFPEKNRMRVHIRRSRERNNGIGNTKVIEKWEKSWRKKKSVRCYWCGNKFRGAVCRTDHMMPVSKGGRHSIENLVISCNPCNARKYNSLLPEWNAKIIEPVLI